MSTSKLITKNNEWVESVTAETPEFFTDLAKGQSPDYLWIGCADSRVPAAMVTGSQPGDLFVHRNIANMVVEDDTNLLSVIEYAVAHLKVKHIIVCGHYGCGGVQASLSDDSLGSLDTWIGHIKKVRFANEEELSALEGEEKVNRLVELNVLDQVRKLEHIETIKKARANEQALDIHAMVFDLASGKLLEVEQESSVSLN